MLAVLALQGVNHQGDDAIKRREDERGPDEQPGQAGVELRVGERQHDQENKDGEVDQPDWINELGNHQLDDAGAVVVIIGQQAETAVEPPAAFAGLNQRGVKRGQPAAVLEAVGERPALGEFVQKML